MNRLIGKGGSVCSVKNCLSVSRGQSSLIKNKASMHRLPNDKIQREEWIKRIITSYEVDDHDIPAKRARIWQPKKNTVICGLHFNRSGRKRIEDTFPIFIGKHVYPTTLFLSRDKLDNDPEGLLENIIAEVTIGEQIVERLDLTVGADNIPQPEKHSDHTYCVYEDPFVRAKLLSATLAKNQELERNHYNLKINLEKCLKENIKLKLEVARLQRENLEKDSKKETNFRLSTVAKNPKTLKYYTGFKSIEEFNILFTSIQPELQNIKMYNNGSGYERIVNRASGSSPGRPMSLDFEDQLFLTLCKLRVGLANEDLAHRFGVSITTTSNYVTTWLDLLYKKLTKVPIWPSRKVIDDFMPNEFKEKFQSTRVIIDCTEFFIENPSDYTVQSDTYSNYKRHNTAKGLIGITPNGFVSFVAPLAPGRMSDTELTLDSGLIKLLEPGDSVMADRGFFIKEALDEKGIGLNIPPFLGGKPQLPVDDEKRTREIAAVRIHVERVIKELKDFRILKFVFSNAMHDNLEKIWKICCYLVNVISEPLLDVNK